MSDASADAPVHPVDRALTLQLQGEWSAAQRWVAAMVQSDTDAPVPLLLAGQLLATVQRHDSARAALQTCVGWSVDAGNLPIAIAAAIELRRLNADPSSQLDEIAQAFAHDSPRLLPRDAVPPELPGRAQVTEPLPETLSGDALLARLEQVVGEAQGALQRERAQRPSQFGLPPHPLLSSLSAAGVRAIMDAFRADPVAVGERLIEQGAPGTEAFILARGEVEVVHEADHEEPVLLARLGNGALFGEMALLSRAPRAASVVASRPGIVLRASKEALDEVAQHQPEVGQVFASYCRRRMVDNLIRSSTILRSTSPAERPQLIERFVTRTFEPGEHLIRQGQQSEGLHLIASGSVAVVHRDQEDRTVLATLGAGDVVGEVALVLRRPSNANVIAELPTVTLHLPRDRFLELIKHHPALLGELYDLAVQRDEETSSVVAQQATAVDDPILV